LRLYGAVWLGRLCLRRTRYHRMSSEWRGASRGSVGRIHFSLPATHKSPLPATDRGGGGEQVREMGEGGGWGERQMDITRRGNLHRAYPRLHPACPQAACQGVTS